MPTDTFIQHIAQQMDNSGWAVLGLIAIVAMVIAIAACIHGVWREVYRDEQRLQHDLERSESRAKAGGHEHP